MQTQNTYARKMVPVDLLDSTLHDLLVEHEDYLKEISMEGDMTNLKLWLEDYRKGSEASGEYLYSYGLQLLETIQCKLQAAEADIQRIDEESPAGKGFTGGRAHRISRAAAAVTKAKQMLEENYQPLTH